MVVCNCLQFKMTSRHAKFKKPTKIHTILEWRGRSMAIMSNGLYNVLSFLRACIEGVFTILTKSCEIQG
jgi:hypothetical protein